MRFLKALDHHGRPIPVVRAQSFEGPGRAGGKRVRITLVMPLMLDPGLITPGSIVQVLQSPSWMGYCLGIGSNAFVRGGEIVGAAPTLPTFDATV
jgi:hypothetical protein